MNPAVSWAASLARVRSRDWLNPILDQLPVGFIIIEAPSGRVLEGNRQLERIFRHPIRYSAGVAAFGEWIGYHADGRQYAPHEWPVARALKGEITRGEEIEIERGDGTRGHISVDASPVRGEDGAIVAGLAIVQDVTDRKLAEERERRAAKRLSDVLESTSDCIFVLDREWRFSFMNQRAILEIAGGQDLTGRSIWEEYPEAVGSVFWDNYQRAMIHREALTFEAYYPAPLDSWYEVTARPSDEGIAVFFRNINVAKAGQKALLESEASAREKGSLLETTLENMDQGLVMVDSSGIVRVCNRRAIEMLDLPKDGARSNPPFESLVAHQAGMGEFDGVAEDRSAWLKLRGNLQSAPPVYERTRPNGKVLEVRTVRLSGGEVVRTFTDITARRQAEAAVRESEARYRLLAENATDVIFRTGLRGERLYLSPASRDIYGYEPEELLGTDAAFLIHPDDAPRMKDDLAATISGKPGHGTTVYRIRHKAGHWVWLEARRRLVRDETGAPVEVVGIIRDISERVQLEDRLRQAQKMEAIGQLTGGIAHEFNNLLMVVMGNAEALAEEIPDPGLRSLATMVHSAAERGAQLTEKLLAFGRRQSLTPERVDLASVVAGMAPLLQRTLGETVELRTEQQKGIHLAITDRTLLESAILNLAVNARDAMPAGGQLTISTGARHAGPGEGPLPIGQAVVYVSVSDTGVGMSPDVRAQAFEPFFTTKGVGEGSGLGLSMVYGFARQAGGHVSIESEVGRGTCVKIVLPAILGNRPQPSARVRVPALSRKRILMVEDAPEVLKFASSQIASLGYEVTAVSNGPDALDILAQGRVFDLLFTDVVLPRGMSGAELAEQVGVLAPDTKVVFTSGYPDEVFKQHGRPMDDAVLLRKPYRRKELADTLRRVLEAG